MHTINTSGEAPKLDTVSGCVIYDANSGKILHFHTVATFGGVKHRSQDEVESEALSLAKESGAALANAKVLHVSEPDLKPGVRYKVDLKTLSLIEDASAN